MIQEKYLRDNSNNYMILESPEKPGEESYQIKMLLKNTLSKFLPVSLKSINNSQSYCYDISSKQPLSRMYEGNNITNDDVINIAMHISQITCVVNEYLLELDYVVLNARLIYMNISDKALYFTYYPYYEKDFGESLRQLFEFVLEHLDHNDKKAVMLTYGIYQKILQNDYNIDNLLNNILEDNEKENHEENGNLYENEKIYENKNLDRKENINKKDNINEKENLDNRESINIKTSLNGQDMDSHSRNSTKESLKNHHIIESVMSEVIEDEKEVRNINLFIVFMAVKALFVIIMIFTAFNVILPRYRMIKIGLVPAAILIALFLIAYKLVDIFYEKNKSCFTKIVKNKEEVEYAVSVAKMDTIFSNIYKGVTDKLSTKNQAEYACTQLLSDFLKESTLSINCRLLAQDDSSNEKEIAIRETPFIIGSYTSKCNYVLSDKLISRMHLRFTKEKSSGAYFVEDLNSTNGTYVNGDKIEPNQKVQIKDSDILKIAVMQYRFTID